MKALPLLLSLLLPTAAATQAVVSSGFIFDDPPTPQIHASTIVDTPDGLVAAWFAGEHERHPEVAIHLSRHENGRWTAPVEVATGVQPDGSRLPTWNPVLFRPTGGPLMLFYKVGPNPREWWGMRIVSRDGGRSWSVPERLPDGIIGPVKNKPVVLDDGTVVSGASTEHDGWRVHFERSHDGGESWAPTDPVNDGEAIGAIQPSILIHPGGRLQALGRTTQGRIFTIESHDRGNSWGEMTLLDLPNPSSGTDAVTLADGRHLLVYNHTTRVDGNDDDRSTLNVAISNDGRAWEAALVLEHEPGHEPGTEFSYPAVIQSSDGLVHVTYTWNRTRVMHVVIDPTRLEGQPIVDGQWP